MRTAAMLAVAPKGWRNPRKSPRIEEIRLRCRRGALGKRRRFGDFTREFLYGIGVRSISTTSIPVDRMEEIIGVFDSGKAHERADEFRDDLATLANTLRQRKAGLVRRPLTLPPLCADLAY
jgi:hypothetical protein